MAAGRVVVAEARAAVAAVAAAIAAAAAVAVEGFVSSGPPPTATGR